MWFLYICADIVITGLIVVYILGMNWLLSWILEGKERISFASSFFTAAILFGVSLTLLLIEKGIF